VRGHGDALWNFFRDMASRKRAHPHCATLGGVIKARSLGPDYLLAFVNHKGIGWLCFCASSEYATTGDAQEARLSVLAVGLAVEKF
jgi:hypothetical protein